MPDFVSEKNVTDAIQAVYAKKKLDLVNEVVFYRMQEGKCVQMLHTGPFDREAETLEIMRDFMEKQRLEKNGLHHEIYLSDFRKTAPAKLRTILREPVR